MAREGAKILVNDLGGSVDGEGNSSNFADQVVAEISGLGGEAVANYASVSDAAGAQSIIDDAVEAFGRIDIVVNNAGILRDKTLVKMTEEMWDAVIAVHLKGTYLVTQAAVRQMIKAGAGGRIINTSSLAGLLGNFGQTNYAAAKAGIAGITRTVAMEGQRAGITVNAIAPVAKTRMTDDIAAVPEQMEPEDVSPLVAWLASDQASDVTGRVFGAHGSHYFEYKMQRTPGVDLGEERWTPARVGEQIEEIGALADAGSASKDETSEGLNREMIGAKYKGAARFVKAEEMVAYAEATDDDNPQYVDVERDEGVIAPPLFAQKLFHEVMGEAITDEALGADLLRLVHGEQDMRFHRLLEPWDLVAARAEICAIEDKSSGQLLTIRQWLVCEGEVVTESTSGLFIRGSGTGGGNTGGDREKKEKAERSSSDESPDREILFEDDQVVADDQPLRYAEASGDHNPIHTDPQVAKSAGLPSVILHGMCTMAFAQKAIVDQACGGDPRRLARLKVRFSKPVLPGQTVTTRVWKEDEAEGVSTFGFDAINDDGEVVLSQGMAEVVESA
jgi:NAD(P)-dependent dehydrogenase (short-subunit alcohol dehydrogenase family)/acyl dehydratase